MGATDEPGLSDIDDALSADGGTRIWFPPSLARFFIPLTDPVPVIDGYSYVVLSPVMPWQLPGLEQSDVISVDGDAWKARIEATLPHDGAGYVDLISEDAEVKDGDGDGDDEGAEHPTAASHHAFGAMLRVWSGSALGDAFPANRHVREVLIRVRALEGHEPEVADAQSEPEEVADIDYSVAEVVVAFPVASDTDPASDAFDSAISFVQRFQRGVYHTKPYPFRLTTKELCPPFLPFDVGSVAASKFSSVWPVEAWTGGGIIMLDLSPWRFTRQTDFRPGDYAKLDQVLLRQAQKAAFSPFMELRREASSALFRLGDYRTSVIWSAAAAEALLDETLRHMMWESGRSPEDSAEPFAIRSIAARVKRSFPSLLGTPSDWDLESPGPMTSWKTDVANLRNRVVHDLLSPSFSQAERALDVIERLPTFLGDLLVQNLPRHFRTAHSLLGNPGLESRQVLTEFNALSDGVIGGPEWVETFARWRATHERLLGDTRDPSPDRSEVRFVYGRANRGYWVLVDSETAQAVRVDVDESTLSDQVRQFIAALLDEPALTDLARAAQAKIDGVAYKRIRTPWREWYQLLPGQNVMVSFSDIHNKEFTWRPEGA